MGILIIKEYGKEARELRLSRGQVRIGRDPQSDVVLEDPGVSRSHAKILQEGAGYLLEDLGSRNGTLLNRRKLPQKGNSPLRAGDVVQVGRSLIRLVLRISRKITTGLRRPVPSPNSKLEAAVGEHREPEKPLCLFRLEKLDANIIICEKAGLTTRRRLESDRVRIGRDSGSDIILQHPSVSQDHAEIVFNREGFYLVDRGSDQGTYLDGVTVRIARLSHRSFIRMGKVKILFILSSGGDEASFGLRDHLLSLFPDKGQGIKDAFRESREHALDFADELVSRAILDPEEWWAAASRYEDEPGPGPGSWISRVFRRRD
jgi:pSer/pThr/pTyr-binding forkhead associated (FHA) protein